MIKKENSLLFAITNTAKQSGWQAMSQPWVSLAVLLYQLKRLNKSANLHIWIVGTLSFACVYHDIAIHS
jgi:hypothetical protein